MSREELEAEVLRLRSLLPGADGEAFGRTVLSTPAGRDALFAAVEKTRTPMILTDPSLPDDPIVFANRAFQELSGYGAHELVGHNCRFLQGPGTDPDHVQAIRDALAAKRDVAVDILNYRRDGTPFLNELFISPIMDRDGRVLYHFGSQVDVTGFRDARRRLAANERRQRAVFDSAADFAIVVTDCDGLVTDWNTGAERIFGWTAEEMRGNTVDRVFTPEDRAKGRPETEMRLARDEGRASDERWHLRKDGSRFWTSGEMMPLLDEVGQHIGFTKIARDRTAEHEAGQALRESEAHLRESEDHLRHTVELNPQVPWTCDPAGNITSYSNRWLELTGQAPGEPDGAGWMRALHPDDIPHTVAVFSRCLASGEPVDVDYRINIAATGTYRWMRARARPRRDAAGAIVAWYGVVEDIHDRRLAEEALRASEEQFRAFAQAVPNHVWASRTDGYLYWFNDQAYAYSGTASGELDGIAAWSKVLHPDDLTAVGEAWARSLATGAVYETEFRIRRADGAYRWFLVRAEPVRDAQGAILRWVGTNTDIDERRRQAEELSILNATLEERVASRTDALMAAEEALRQSQKMEAVGQLTGGLAHDFNNMLAGIVGSLELMQTRMLQGRMADMERYIGAAQGAAKRAAALTHRLLAFSRRQTLDPKPTDVNRLVEGMLDLVRRTVGPAVTVEFVGIGGLWPTLVDPSQLENALLNLCINARDAMPDGGRITVETGNRWLDERGARERDLAPGQYVSLCVSDTGTGMTPDVVAKAFDPFFTTKPLGEGTGLGLSMIYGFAKQSGGQVRIYSEVGQGTMVCVYLPRHLGDAEDGETVSGLSDAARAKVGETVLVVDDEPTVRMLVTEVLEDLGYAAIEAADGASGLKVLQSDVRIDLLVTDVGLPGGLNGRQMADAARERRPDLKVLFITGYAENAVLNHGHLAHGTQVMTKPFALEALAARIRGIIEGHG